MNKLLSRCRPHHHPEPSLAEPRSDGLRHAAGAVSGRAAKAFRDRSALFVLALLSCVKVADAATDVATQSDAALRATQAPVSASFRLGKRLALAAEQGRLGLKRDGEAGAKDSVIPVQWEMEGTAFRATWITPATGPWRAPLLSKSQRQPFAAAMAARVDARDGQVDLTEGPQPVLRYNYRTIEPGEALTKISDGNRIYARPRSDYIHPLYGLSGEVLTRDWSLDHPHHRGIYWAWPEVDYGSERGDLHALQRVFARPTGKLKLTSGPVFAQVEAENDWRWEDREPIVRECAVIRAYRATESGRIVDLMFRFTGLREGVTLARRETTHYGGLNLRLATPQSQAIAVNLDPPGALPRRAWSDLSGVFRGTAASGLTVLQHRLNPEYPGEWVQYPDLSWCQPTFPSSGTRYPLPSGQALVLRFRLWIHAGAKPGDDALTQLWDAWHTTASARVDPRP